MADNELVLLDQALAEQQAARTTPISDDHAFEVFACEQVLRDLDLSNDEIESGVVGGGNDGAIDGVYVFLGETLLEEDSEQLQNDFPASKIPVGAALTLYLVQAKRETGFSETAIDLVASSTQRLLDLGEDEDALSVLYSDQLLSRLQVFRRALQKFASRHLSLRVRFYYATRGRTSEINAKVLAKAKDLEAQFDSVLVGAQGQVEFLGSKELWSRVSTVPSYTLQLTYQEASTSGNSHVALVKLRDYLDFLTDGDGSLRRYIFDWNVRDYQGEVEVNKEIRESLLEEGLPEFWWLNNGITIVCSRTSIVSKTFSLDDVQVVNGLQTSHTIFNALSGVAGDHPALDRCVLVRILVTGDDSKTRDQVIRATNRQTSVPEASLRATDEIQRSIEAFFLANDWYYDRRKNYYRNSGKPVARIVGIPLLAQAVMAMGLGEPDNSRARPSSLLKRESDYRRVFDSSLPLSVYLWLAKAQKAVDAYLLSESAAASAAERTNLRFHLAMLSVAVLNEGRVHHPSQLRGLANDGAGLTDGLLATCLGALRPALNEFAAQTGYSLDKVAKGGDFVTHLFAEVLPPLLADPGNSDGAAGEDMARAETGSRGRQEEDG